MRGLLLFVAGLLCGGAAVSWLFLSREPAAPVAVESSLPVPAGTSTGVTGLEPGADDLPLSKPSRDPHDAPGQLLAESESGGRGGHGPRPARRLASRTAAR